MRRTAAELMSLGSLSQLQDLTLSVANCVELRNVESLAAIANIHGLSSLTLDAENCTSLESIDPVCDAIASLRKLSHLDLNFESAELVLGPSLDGSRQVLRPAMPGVFSLAGQL